MLPRAAGALEFEPIAFEKLSKPVVLAADQRLELRETGSLEIGFELREEDIDSLPSEMVLVAQERADAQRFSISLVNGAKALKIVTPSKTATVPFDISFGGFFQLGLTGRGDFIHVHVNDSPSPVELPAGFGPMKRFPLQVGGRVDGRLGFVGLVHYVRVWDGALNRTEYRAVADDFGLPPDLTSVRAKLLLYTEFTDEGGSAFYTAQPTLQDIDDERGNLFGSPEGTPSVSILPLGSPLRGFVLRFNDERVLGVGALVENDLGAVDQTPIVGLLEGQNGKVAEFRLEDGETLKMVSASLTERMLRFRNPDGSITSEPRRHLRSLSFLTSKGRWSPVFGKVGPAGAGERLASAAVGGLDFSELDALYGYADGKGLNGFGLAWGLSPPVQNLDGRWGRAGREAPVKAEKPATLGPASRLDRHGTYEFPDVMRLASRNRGLVLEVFAPDRFVRLRLQPDGTYAFGSNVLRFDSENRLTFNKYVYNKAKPYTVLDSSQGFGPLGGQFNSPNQVPLYQFSYFGYDLTEVNPMNLQDGSSRRTNVLHMPAATSLDYEPTLAHNVPHGMSLALDAMTTSQSVSTIARNASEHAEIQAHAIGFSIGVPKTSSFGVKSKVTQESQKSAATETQIAYHQELETHYSLVVDMRRVNLDPVFRGTLMRMAQRVRYGGTLSYDDYKREIIDVFGTHYAHAMTTGRMSRSLMRFSKQASGELHRKGHSIAETASDTFGQAKSTPRGVKPSFDNENSNDFSEELRNELSKEMAAMTGVGLPDQPVPVFMDLRPIDELLGSYYWDDTIIVDVMQKGLREAIRTYVAANAPDFTGPEFIWEPYWFSARFESAVFEAQSAAHDVDAVFGEFGFDYNDIELTPIAVKTIPESDPIYLGDDKDAEGRHTIDLPDTEQEYVFTAKELCAGFPHAIRFGSRINYYKLGFGAFSHSTKTREPVTWYVSPLNYNLGVDWSGFRFTDQVPRIDMPFSVFTQARRQPDPDGSVKPYPTCKSS